MKRFVAAVSQDSPFQPMISRLGLLNSRIEERKKFLSTQAINLQKDYDAGKKEIWDEMIATMKALKLLPPEYKEEDFHFHVEGEDVKVIFLCNEHSGGLPDFLKHLIEIQE